MTPLSEKLPPRVVRTKIGNPPIDKAVDLESDPAAGINFIETRTLFGDELGFSLTKKPPLTLPVEMGSNSRELVAKALQVNKTAFQRFSSGLTSNFVVAKSILDADPAFQKDFLELRDLELDVRRRRMQKQRYLDLRGKINLRLVGFPAEAREGANKYLNSYIKLEKERHVAVKISSLDKEGAKPEILMVVNKWRQEIKQLDEEYQKGSMSEGEYFARRDEINGKAVKNSGDKELEELWGCYKQDEVESVKNNIMTFFTPGPTEKPVENKSLAIEAFGGIGGTNVGLDIHENGTASVTVGPEKFPLEVSVYRDEATSKYVYYVFDKYADDGVVRVDSGDLLGAFDQRYLDSYLSSKLGMAGDGNNSPSKIPDRDLIYLSERLLGAGKDRGYKIMGDNKTIMDGLLEVLATTDEKYLDYYLKVRVLIIFLQKDDHVALVRRMLLKGKRPIVSDLMNGVW